MTRSIAFTLPAFAALIVGCNSGQVPSHPSIPPNPEDVVLRQVGNALYDYDRFNGQFPSRVATVDGKRQSWRYQVLPFLLGNDQGRRVQRIVSEMGSISTVNRNAEIEDGVFVAEEPGRDTSVLCGVFLVAESRIIWDSDDVNSQKLRDLHKCSPDVVLAIYCEDVAMNWWSTSDISWDMLHQRLVLIGDNPVVLMSKEPRSILMADGSVRHVSFDELRKLLNAANPERL